MSPPLKIFSLDEANALLPQLESLLTELESQYEAFRRLEDELFFEELVEQTPPSETRLQGLEEALVQMEEGIRKIRRLGCLLRHLERGQVDFLSRREESWICYCWRRGEKEVQFYHSLDGGFFQRRPLN